MKQCNEFIFAGYSYDKQSGVAEFNYSFDNERWFKETVSFEPSDNYNQAVLGRALFTAYIIAGISYYKCFPTAHVRLRRGSFSKDEAYFFSTVYRDGLSQFVYENQLEPETIARFEGDHSKRPLQYEGSGTVVLQSGGKDSLLLAELLLQKSHDFTVEYMKQSKSYPSVIDEVGAPVSTFTRTLDKGALALAAEDGALNGHVPVTYIVLAYSLVDAILKNKSTLLAAIGQEGEEPHVYIGQYAIRHQWAKTWRAEQLFSDFVHRSLATSVNVGSPLRGYSELKIAELFTDHCWAKYGNAFSSCNRANYMQGHNNTQLQWCADCPKCANSFLLFAAFLEPEQLVSLFGGDLFADSELTETFMGLLGVNGVMKPFECVGEVSELRSAYWLAQHNGYARLPFDVPESDFDRNALAPSQPWAYQMIQ